MWKTIIDQIFLLFFLGCEFNQCYLTKKINHFGYEQTEHFDAIIFGMPNEMSDEVIDIFGEIFSWYSEFSF